MAEARRRAFRRMMRAHVDAVQMGAVVLELGNERGVDRGQDLLGEVSASEARLVRDDDRGDACAVQPANCLGRSRQESKSSWVIDVPDFLGERPVTIHEDHGPTDHERSVCSER